MFAVRPMMEVAMGVLREPGLGADLRRLVHGEQHMVFHRGLRVGERVVASAQVAGIEERGSGEVLVLDQRLATPAGEVLVEASGVMFIRGEGKGVKKGGGEEQAVRGAPSYVASQVVAPDQAARYAEASGDGNPIHVDEAFARAAGLPGTILHGLCTMAFAARALVDGPGGGEPGALAEASVRFARPVFMGDEVTTRIWEGDGEGEWVFEARNQRDEVVLSRGRARIVSG
jgi:acyl dehydratase